METNSTCPDSTCKLRNRFGYCTTSGPCITVNTYKVAVPSDSIEITEGEAETIIAFIKNHERDEIPDDVWDLCMKLINLTDRI